VIHSSACFHLYVLSAQIPKNFNISKALNKKRQIFFSFYQSKKAKTKNVVAIKALSNKLSRASYYIMRDHVAFDQDELFR
jgi:hypothetical protein